MCRLALATLGVVAFALTAFQSSAADLSADSVILEPIVAKSVEQLFVSAFAELPAQQLEDCYSTYYFNARLANSTAKNLSDGKQAFGLLELSTMFGQAAQISAIRSGVKLSEMPASLYERHLVDYSNDPAKLDKILNAKKAECDYLRKEVGDIIGAASNDGGE